MPFSTLYIPPGDPSCFPRSGVAQGRGEISMNEYLDNILPHLSGTIHPQDTCSIKKILFHPISMAIQSCLFEPNFTLLQDTNEIHKLLLHCWNEDFDEVKLMTMPVLTSIESNGISKNIFEAMLCIAIEHSNVGFLEYYLTLDYGAPDLIAQHGPILNATVHKPDRSVYRILLDNGLLDQPSKGHRPLVGSLALRGLEANIAHQEFLELLLQYGLIISGSILRAVAKNGDVETMQYLSSKCDLKDLESSDALFTAAGSSCRMVEFLLDSGINVNNEVDMRPPLDFDELPRGTALHVAASLGHMDIVKLLLERGASKIARDAHRNTAAVVARQNRYAHVAAFIENFET